MAVFPQQAWSGLEQFGTWLQTSYDNLPPRRVEYISKQHVGRMLINLTNPKRGGVYVNGGPWLTWKSSTKWSKSAPLRVYEYGELHYTGSLRSDTSGAIQHGVVPSDWSAEATLNGQYSALLKRGSEAWNRLRPDKPDFTLATSVYELREFLPGLKRQLSKLAVKTSPGRSRSRSTLSKTGQWHLAIQFGYLPLIRDILSFYVAQRDGQKRLEQLIRDAGRPVRRRATLRDSLDSDAWAHTPLTKNAGSGTLPVFVFYSYVESAHWRQVSTQVVGRTWAMGRFRYLLPPGPRNVEWREKMMNRIIGLRITPRDLYQVIPWSWLVDYFTGLGDFINATSAGVADNLVADYAYIMRRIEYRSYEVTYLNLRTTAANTGNTRVHTDKETLRRVNIRCRASPFGFGLKDSDLSAHQVGILGALGLSRLP